MKTKCFGRRNFLKGAAAVGWLGMGASLFAEDVATGKSANSKGFKIGGVDWELASPNNPEAFAVAARLGLDGVQIDLGDVVSMKSAGRQQVFFDAAKKHNVEIASLAAGLFYNMPLGTDRRAPELLDAAIDIATAMKQKVILLACFNKSDLMQPAEQLNALIGRIKEHASKAEKAGVVLGLECECTVEHYAKVLDRINSPAVMAYFDTGHAHVDGRDVVAEIKLLKDRICEFHAKDVSNPLLGQGKINFSEVRQGMDAIGYRGWIQIEQWNEIQGKKPLGFDETHRRNLTYLRQQFPKRA